MSQPIPFVPRGQRERLEQREEFARLWHRLNPQQQKVIAACIRAMPVEEAAPADRKERATILPFRPTNRE